MLYQDRVRFRIRKIHAVFTASFLVFIALVLARFLPLMLQRFSTSVPQERPVLEFLVSGLFLLLSFGMMNGLISDAIDEAAKEKYETELRELLEKQTSENINTMQELEFYSVLPSAYRKQPTKLLGVQGSRTFEDIERDSRIRDAIVCGLRKDETLEAIAVKACSVVLKRVDRENFNNDSAFIRFCQDVHIYLRAWLIFSIKYQRDMPIESIQQGFPNQDSPQKIYYIRAIQYIRDTAINKPAFDKCLEEEYREEAKEIVTRKLDRLIELLRNHKQ